MSKNRQNKRSSTMTDKVRAHMEKIRKSLGAIDANIEDGNNSIDRIKDGKNRLKEELIETAFGQAFSAARLSGKSTFDFGGKSFNTRQAGETDSKWKSSLKPSAPVPAPRLDRSKVASSSSDATSSSSSTPAVKPPVAGLDLPTVKKPPVQGLTLPVVKSPDAKPAASTLVVTKPDAPVSTNTDRAPGPTGPLNRGRIDVPNDSRQGDIAKIDALKSADRPDAGSGLQVALNKKAALQRSVINKAANITRNSTRIGEETAWDPDTKTERPVKHYNIVKVVRGNPEVHVGKAKTKKGARMAQDRRDNEYGAYVHKARPVFEDSEQVDEVSNATLRSYSDKAKKDQKRSDMVRVALKKLAGNKDVKVHGTSSKWKYNEEVETTRVNEVSDQMKKILAMRNATMKKHEDDTAASIAHYNSPEAKAAREEAKLKSVELMNFHHNLVRSGMSHVDAVHHTLNKSLGIDSLKRK